MTCPSPQDLLAYAEGADLPAVQAHVAACTACSAQLAELGAFETMLADHATLPGAQRERLRATTARLLRGDAAAARPGSVRRFPLWPALGVAALAAALFATLSLWPTPHGLTDLDVRRYAPEGELRSDRSERFALSLRTTEPRWLAIWAIGDGTGRRLLPDASAPLPTYGVTFPLPAGDHRVPAAELLDFEFPVTAAPQRLLVVPTAAALDDAQLAAIDAAVRTGDRAVFWPEVARRHPEARLVEFPAR